MGGAPESDATGAELEWLSWNTQRPCLLLKMGSFKLLIDCTLTMESLASFLPCSMVRSNRISWQKKIHPYGKGSIPVLKQLNELVYAELMPEIRTLKFDEAELASIDAVLISNIASLIAMPFLTSSGKFRGNIYATDPVIQLGKLIMEDLSDMFERVDRASGDEWPWKSIASSFPNVPTSDPTTWQQFYTRDVVNECIARMHRVFFSEEIMLKDELKIIPFSSGYSIGSCNWLLKIGEQKIGYLAASSLRQSHPKTLDVSAFSKLDSLIITSLSTIDQSPDVTVYKFAAAVVETLKMGGNVLIPIVPTGLLYDLFECVLKAIEVNNLSRSIPVYFISSVAESCLEFANIFPEWLSDDKGSRVYKPEEPFYHSELVRSGRIRVFNSLHGNFSRECRQPCIVFAGHPSLRIGEAVHLLDFWGNDSRNAIMMVDPDYPLEVYYSPYKKLAIRAYYFPIETRLEFVQILKKISDLAPKHVIYPEEYAPIFGTLSAVALPTTAIRQNDPIKLDMFISAEKPIERRKKMGGKEIGIIEPQKKKIRVDSEILKGLKMNPLMCGLSAVNGQLVIHEQSLELQPTKTIIEKKQQADEPKVSTNRSQDRYTGKLNLKHLLEVLDNRKLAFEIKQEGTNPSIHIKNYSATITILRDGQRTLINCLNATHRRTIQGIVHECLSRFTGGESSHGEPQPAGTE